jgi:predicted acylesterase/phospholipase RssA
LRLRERFQVQRPLEEMEVALVRATLARPSLLTPGEEAVLRHALSLARVYRLRTPGRVRELRVEARLAPLRDEVVRRLAPVLLGPRAPRRDQLVPHVRELRERCLAERDALCARYRDHLPPEALDREVRHKSLVLVSGGGGGTGYVYLGVMGLLEEHGLRPKLLAGTSIGAILSLFRARGERFDATATANILRTLSWGKLFRFMSTESRYGVPAALRLYLRAGIGRFFDAEPGGEGGLRLSDLPIPTLVAVSGVRAGMLPRPLDFYERLLGGAPVSALDPVGIARRMQAAVTALGELFARPEVMRRLTLGKEPGTEDFDVVDAAGFSCALPGVIHYDVLRDDARMRGVLDGLFERRGVARLVDGGLTDNLPARAAWRAVHGGRIGTRNVFILGLDGFAPRLTTPLWLPLQRLAAMTVAANLPYAHLVKHFRRTLSPLELVPSVELAGQAMTYGREQMRDELPLLLRMLEPLPPL